MNEEEKNHNNKQPGQLSMNRDLNSGHPKWKVGVLSTQYLQKASTAPPVFPNIYYPGL